MTPRTPIKVIGNPRSKYFTTAQLRDAMYATYDSMCAIADAYIRSGSYERWPQTTRRKLQRLINRRRSLYFALEQEEHKTNEKPFGYLKS